MLPGTLWPRDFASHVFKRIADELGGSNALDWVSMSIERGIALLEGLPFEECYLYYEHPVHDFKHQCSRAPKRVALQFLREQFEPGSRAGLDLYLTPLDFSVIFAGNHDGDFFRAK